MNLDLGSKCDHASLGLGSRVGAWEGKAEDRLLKSVWGQGLGPHCKEPCLRFPHTGQCLSQGAVSSSRAQLRSQAT